MIRWLQIKQKENKEGSPAFEIIEERDILEEKYHLSYPYIFTHENKNYALIESHRVNKLELYEVTENLSLKKIKTIFEKPPLLSKYMD
mgnify:CR=1 FL=1